MLKKLLKGTLTRDFWPLFFFHQTTSPGSLIHRLKPFRIPYCFEFEKIIDKVGCTAVSLTAVSLTPMWHAQGSHWHCWDMHSGVIDTAVQPTFFRISSRIIGHIVFCKEIWLRCTRHSGVIETLWHAQQSHWHCCSNMTLLWLWTSYSSGSGYL
jgi:hypothetical protein